MLYPEGPIILTNINLPSVYIMVRNKELKFLKIEIQFSNSTYLPEI